MTSFFAWTLRCPTAAWRGWVVGHFLRLLLEPLPRLCHGAECDIILCEDIWIIRREILYISRAKTGERTPEKFQPPFFVSAANLQTPRAKIRINRQMRDSGRGKQSLRELGQLGRRYIGAVIFLL